MRATLFSAGEKDDLAHDQFSTTVASTFSFSSVPRAVLAGRESANDGSGVDMGLYNPKFIAVQQ